MDDIASDIIKKAAEGDMAAFQEVYTMSSSFVYNVAYRVVGNAHDAQEVSQEVYINIYKHLKNFRFESSFKTWVYRITANHAINYAKKQSKMRANVIYDEQTMEGQSVEASSHQQMDQEQQQKNINELLEAVNPDQRACLVLRAIEGLSYEEIATALGVNINTVRTRLKRAREKILSLRKKVEYEHL